MALLLLALLPVPPKLKDNSRRAGESSAENHDTIHRVLEKIFKGLQRPGKDGVVLGCADGNKRLCFPILCGWIADHMEHVYLHNIKNNACPKCEVPLEWLGEPSAGPEHPKRDHDEYQLLIRQHRATGDLAPIEELVERGLNSLFNAFWTLPRVDPAEIAKPDLLHTVYLGILKHMMEWIQEFLKKHNRLDFFDKAWSTMGPYPGFTVPTKAYREVSQWQGKEMRNLGRIVTAAFATALRAPSDAQRMPFRIAIQCVTALVDFHLMAQYKTHTEQTLQYMQDYLNAFHKNKHVFREFRAGKRAIKEARGEVGKIAIRHANAAQARAQKGTSATKRRKIARDDREELVSAKVEEATKRAHFNFIKMHLLQHFQSHVRRYGSIPIFSTDVSELAHKAQIKESYRRSNRNNAMLQILDNYNRVHTLAMRVINIAATLPEAPTYLEKARTDPEMKIFMDAILKADMGESSLIKTGVTPRRKLRSLIKGEMRVNLSDLANDMGISGLPQSILNYAKLSGKNCLQRGCLSVHELQKLPVERFNMLEVPVPVFQDPDSYIMNKLRCTGERSFRGCSSRNDWVWVEVGDGYGATGDLRGRLPGRLRGLLKLRDTSSGASLRLAVVELLRAVNGGEADPYDTLIRVHQRVYKAPEKACPTFDIASILGMAHLVGYGEGVWLVNNRIDLGTWNEIYAGAAGQT